MSLTITVKFHDYDLDEDVEHVLPGHKVVCYSCEGTGYHLTPSIGEHAYSQEEFDEAFEPGSEDREEYFRRGGRYDIVCQTCHGKNVVDEVDEEACTSQHQKDILEKYDYYLDKQTQYASEDAAERRAGY